MVTLAEIIDRKVSPIPASFTSLTNLLSDYYSIPITDDKELNLDFLLISKVDKSGKLHFSDNIAEEMYKYLAKEGLSYLTIGLIIPKDNKNYTSRGAFYYPIGEVLFENYSTAKYISEIKELKNTAVSFLEKYYNERNPVCQLISIIASDVVIEKTSRLLLLAQRLSEKNIYPISSELIYNILRNIYYAVQIFSSSLVDGDEKFFKITDRKFEKGLDNILIKWDIDIITDYYSKDKNKRVFRPREGSNEIANLLYFLYIGEKIYNYTIEEGFNLDTVSSIFYGGLTTGLFSTYSIENVFKTHNVDIRFITVSRNERILNRYLKLEDIDKILESIPSPLRRLWTHTYRDILLCDDSVVSGRAMMVSAIFAYLLTADQDPDSATRVIDYIKYRKYRDLLKYLENEGIYTSAVTMPNPNKGYHGDEKMIDPSDVTFKPLFVSWGTGVHENHAKKVLNFFGLRYDKSSERISVADSRNKHFLRLKESLNRIYNKYNT